MIEIISDILVFMLNALRRAWPFILISIPLSVAINVSGAGERVRTIIGRNPVVSILLATLFGALSPLCSCTVIPVIFSLLVAGVPLGPVMSFWIASPSMDPEIFFLSVSTLGWDLAIWRLAATFALSLSAGFAAHYLVKKGAFAGGILRSNPNTRMLRLGSVIAGAAGRLFKRNRQTLTLSTGRCCNDAVPVESAVACCCGSDSTARPTAAAASAGERSLNIATPAAEQGADSGCGCSKEQTTPGTGRAELVRRIRKESLSALLFVGKFMVIAFFIEALIILFVPESFIERLLGSNTGVSIVLSTLFGLPFYTTNLAALGILGGLLEKGMIPGAALAFLISGPTTTLPAMSAVFGIAKPRVFVFYLSLALLGAILFGVLFTVVAAAAG